MSSTAAPISWNAERVRSTVSTPSSVRLAPSATTPTTFSVSTWISEISPAIWPAADCDSSASLRTSSATTAKPLPCSPARAASIAALSASRLVCSAIPVIVSTMPPIRCERAESCSIAPATCCEDAATPRIASVACSAASTPLSATRRASSAASAVEWAVCGAHAGGAGGLLDGLAGGLDHPHLALGALRDVGDGGGDLADGAAGLLRRGGHVARRVAEVAAVRSTWPTSSRRLVVMAANERPSASRSDFGSTVTVRSPAAIRSAAAPISFR